MIGAVVECTIQQEVLCSIFNLAHRTLNAVCPHHQARRVRRVEHGSVDLTRYLREHACRSGIHQHPLQCVVHHTGNVVVVYQVPLLVLAHRGTRHGIRQRRGLVPVVALLVARRSIRLDEHLRKDILGSMVYEVLCGSGKSFYQCLLGFCVLRPEVVPHVIVYHCRLCVIAFLQPQRIQVRRCGTALGRILQAVTHRTLRRPRKRCGDIPVALAARALSRRLP